MKKTMCGIIDISVRIPSFYIEQSELAAFLKLEEGKLITGLGLREATVCAANEDVVSLALNAVDSLLSKNGIDHSQIGRLEVGTESNWDSSKSLKSYLMQLFKDNKNICGADSVNACYGGTNALLNALAWADSPYWNGKYAVVVCADTAFYGDPNLIPLAGSAAVAILIGPDPILKIIPEKIFYHFDNTDDFCKPIKTHPYPIINGKLSISVYTECFNQLYDSISEKENDSFFDFLVCHTPYPRLPEKVCALKKIEIEKLTPSLIWPRKVGNSYTASAYISLVSLLYNCDVMVGQKILFFSFGSGCASSMFLIEKVRPGLDTDKFDVFGEREKVTPEVFVSLVNYEMRRKSKKVTGKNGYVLLGDVNGVRKYQMFKGD